MKRGEIYMADLGEPVGHEQGLRRPVLLVNAQPWLEANPPVVMAVPLTRTYRGSRTHVEIEQGSSGLRVTSYAKCEDLRAISPERFERCFGQVDDVVLFEIEKVLRRMLAL